MSKKKTPTSVPAKSTTDEEQRQQPVSNNVLKLRRARKWTQWQLAEISRLSPRTIQRIERGARMGITAELALAGAFEAEISELYAAAPSGKGSETNPDAPPPKTTRILKRLASGTALLDVIETELIDFAAGLELEERQRQAVEDFLQHMSVRGLFGQEIEPDARRAVCQVFQTKLDELDACGVYVFGGRSGEPRPDGTSKREGMLVFKRADDPQIIQPRLLQQFGKEMCLITIPVDRESASA